jgi:hypothetical protein
MKFSEKLRLRKLEKLIESHNLSGTPNFIGIAAAMATALPKASAECIFYSSVYMCEIMTDFAEKVAEHDRQVALAERARIAEIVKHGIEHGDLQSAVNLALQSELSAADAIEILRTRDGGAPLKSN